MTLSVVKSKRKVSCLPCRTRKVRCDGGQQPCQRCIKRKTTEQCTYLTPGQVGRRPKNAVWNKLVLNLSTEQSSTRNYCKEFIFENVCYAIPVDAIFINDDSTKNLYHFINTLFNYEEPIMQIAVSRINKAIPFLPDVKIYDLVDMFAVSTVELINVVINKFSVLPMDNFNYYEAISASIIQDMAFKYFSEPPPIIPNNNPLSLLSPHQAIHMIDIFFTVNPHSIMLNKTLITQGYWTDTVDPLLLCVVYGTATYMAKMLDGRPLGLWEAADEMSRNPFLDYAYILVQRSSSEVSLGKYQAVVLLGLFEMVHGLPKRGFQNLGLSFMIGLNLGTSDGTYQEKSNDIQAELATFTFWSTFNGNCRGVVDMGHVPHYSNKGLSQKLPPPNVEQSVSYQFEKSSGDLRNYKSFDFVVESFYIHSATCRLTIQLLLQLPEVRHNIFYPRLKKSKADLRQVGYPKPDDLSTRMQQVLDDFGVFIEETKHTLSKTQVYSLEMVRALYELHVVFIKNTGPVMDGLNFGNTAYDFFQNIRLVPGDPMTMAKIRLALPKVYAMMDKTHDYLLDHSNGIDPYYLPRGLIVSVLESSMETLFMQLASDPWDESSFEYLKMVEKITQQQDIWADWSAIGTVQAKMTKYFDEGYTGASTMPTSGISLFDDQATQSSTSTDNSNNLAYAAFFDPCGTWLNPMRNTVVDLKLLPNLPESLVPTIEASPGPNTTLSSHNSSDYSIHNIISDYSNQNNTSDYSDHNNTSDYSNHNNISDYSNHNNTSDYSNHNNTSDYSNHNNTSDYSNHNNTTDYSNHNNTSDYSNHNNTNDYIHQNNYYNTIVQPSPTPSLEYSTDLMKSAFITELEISDDNQVPVLNNNNNNSLASNYLSPNQYNISNDLEKWQSDQSNELFMPIQYPTPSDDQPFV